MKIIKGTWARSRLLACVDYAIKHSTCIKSRCGALIELDGSVVAIGSNHLPGNAPFEICIKDISSKNLFSSDEHCCIHAEQDAILSAKTSLIGAKMYFARADAQGQMVALSAPKCTICSKLALEVGITSWVLFVKKGIMDNEHDAILEFDAHEYNKISFSKILVEAL